MHSRRWQKLNLIWIAASELTITNYYGLFWFISTEDLAYFISIFSLVSWFVLFLAAPALRVRKAWNLMGTSVRNGQQFFILFGRKYYFIQKLKFFHYNNISGNVIQTSGVIDLITLLYAKLRFHNFRVIFMF